MKKKTIEIATVREIAQVCDFKDVIRALEYHYRDYPRLRGKYGKMVFNRFKNAPKRKHRDSIERIILRYAIFITLDKKDERDAYYSVSTNKFSLSFRLWNEIANIPIAHETLKSYSFEEILAHLIWEVTWYGNE